MDKKTNSESKNFETSKKGIFAAGDICSYPGKLKLVPAFMKLRLLLLSASKGQDQTKNIGLNSPLPLKQYKIDLKK